MVCLRGQSRQPPHTHLSSPHLASFIPHPQHMPPFFVVLQAMEDGCLAVMVPLMIRALRERSAVVQRRSSVIIENMSKLVQDPAEARPFLPQLMPLLDRVANEAADPELREVGAGWSVWWVLVDGCCASTDLAAVLVAGSMCRTLLKLSVSLFLTQPLPPLPSRSPSHSHSLRPPSSPPCLSSQVGARARDALQRVKEAADQQEAEVGHAADAAEVTAALRAEVAAAAPPGTDLDCQLAVLVLAHVAAVGQSLITAKSHSVRWVLVAGGGRGQGGLDRHIHFEGAPQHRCTPHPIVPRLPLTCTAPCTALLYLTSPHRTSQVLGEPRGAVPRPRVWRRQGARHRGCTRAAPVGAEAHGGAAGGEY